MGNGDGVVKNISILVGRQGIWHKTLGIFMYRGKIILVYKGEPPVHTDALIFNELVELDGNLRFKYEAIVSPQKLFLRVTCVDEDCIWRIQESKGYGGHIICLDFDSLKLKKWSAEDYPFMLIGKNWLSMSLSFYPCTLTF